MAFHPEVLVGIFVFPLISEDSADGGLLFIVSGKTYLVADGQWLPGGSGLFLLLRPSVFFGTIPFEAYVPFPLVLSQKSLFTPPSYSQRKTCLNCLLAQVA